MKSIKRKMKKKRINKSFVSPVFIPTFLGFRLNRHNINQLWDWNTLENIKI